MKKVLACPLVHFTSWLCHTRTGFVKKKIRNYVDYGLDFSVWTGLAATFAVRRVQLKIQKHLPSFRWVGQGTECSNL